MTATPLGATGIVASVVGGVDTHAETIHVGVLDSLGRELGDREFPTTPVGYDGALAFVAGFGAVIGLGIEGTSSYGAGIARAARKAGLETREVIRPERSVRRLRGKSDPIDAYQAARAVLSGQAAAAPKDENIEALRALNNARRSAIKARTAAMNQIHHLLIAAPTPVREKYRHLKDKPLLNALAAGRPDTQQPTARAVLTALKTLARRHQFLTAEADDLRRQIRDLARVANPHLMSLYGVGPASAAQLLITAGGNPDRLRSEASFAALCGTLRSRRPRARPPATGSPAAETGMPTVPCTPSRSSECRPTRGPARTSARSARGVATTARSSDFSSARSLARSSSPSPTDSSHPT